MFRADVIDALRQPLESGEITVARAEESVTLPARGLVVLAANPCPCGDYYPRAGKTNCQCSEISRRAYQAKVSGPITDRIDITRWVRPAPPHDRDDPIVEAESSATMRERVEVARERQTSRYADHGWRLNGQAPGPALHRWWPVDDAGQRLLDDQVYAGRLSRRGAVRAHRLAWTVLDLDHRPGRDQRDRPGRREVDVALRLRHGDPLPAATLEQRPHHLRRAS